MKNAYINGIILDGTKDMVPVSGKAIITEGKKITEIIDRDQVSGDCKVIDLNGMYVMPGMINLHAHLPGTGKPPKKRMNLVGIKKLIGSCGLTRKVGEKIIANNAKVALMSGTTTVRGVGTLFDLDARVRDSINKGKTVGPRILTANTAISVPGGHMAGSFAYEATSAEDAAHYVDLIAKENPDLIKLMITGGVMDAEVVGEPGVLRMPADYVKAACDRAHHYGLPVAAHCESQEGVLVALKNGVDTIEHGAKPNEEMIRLFKETGACDVCTISPAIPYYKLPTEITHFTADDVLNSEIVFNGVIDCAKACLENGIKVGLGTDSACSFSTQYGMWRELAHFVKYCGVSNSFAIHTATQVNAEIIHLDDVTGTIEPGKYADMIFVKGNPLDDLSVLRDPCGVVFEGTYYKDPSFKKFEEVETELDKLM